MQAPHKSGEILLAIDRLTIPLPYGGDRPFAVQDVTIDLRAGELLCIVGESGSGKSMSANAIMGLLPSYLQPTQGSIHFRGNDLLQQTEAQLLAMRGKHIGMIFQEPLSALNPLMPVGAQIAEVMEVHQTHSGEVRRHRVLELMGFVGLPDVATLQHAYPFTLSGGQRQRVMIAMALVLEPALLIADEPTTALDVTTQKQILALIRRIQQEKGMGVMFITHDFGVVAEIADRVVVMEKGVVVEQGTATQVLYHPQHPYTQRLISAVPHAGSRLELKPAEIASMQPVLEVCNLRKTYYSKGGWLSRKRETVAVSNVSFSLQAGETLGIVGESGSGKSTIAKCLMRLLDVDGGQIAFEGRDISRMPETQLRPLRRDFQMIFQDPFASLNPRHTVGRILTDGPLAHGIDAVTAEARARELLDVVGLGASAFHRYPNEFSGGQRQRIGIARALVLKPRLLVCDESVSALDVSVQAQVLGLLRRLQEDFQLAIVFITHDLRVAAQVCHRIAVMHKGEVVEMGETTKVFAAPQHAYTRRLIDAIPGKQWDPAETIAQVAAAAAFSSAFPTEPALL